MMFCGGAATMHLQVPESPFGAYFNQHRPTVAHALSSSIMTKSVEPERTQSEAGRKLFEMVQACSGQRSPSPILISLPQQLNESSTEFFVKYFEHLMWEKKKEYITAVFKIRSDQHTYRHALINQKFLEAVNIYGTKMTVVIRGSLYNAYLNGILMWSLSRAILYEMGFLPGRISRLVVEKVEKDDLNNLDDMSYMFEELEHLAIPLLPVTNPIGIELIQSFDKTLKSLDCSALLLKNPLIKTLKLQEFRCTNVSWADDLNEVMSFRANKIVVNASPVLNLISLKGLQCYNALVETIVFLNVAPISESMEKIFNILISSFPHLKCIRLQFVNNIIGDVPENVKQFAKTCTTSLAPLAGSLFEHPGFNLEIVLRSLFSDVLSMADGSSATVQQNPTQFIKERLTLKRNFFDYTTTYICEHIQRQNY